MSSQASVLTQSAALSPVPGPSPSSVQSGALLSPNCYNHQHGQVSQNYSPGDPPPPTQPSRSRHAQYDSNTSMPVHHQASAAAGNNLAASGNIAHDATEEHDMEPQVSPGGDRVWQESQEQGYLAPGASLPHGALVGSGNNYTNNNYQNNNNTEQEHNIQVRL